MSTPTAATAELMAAVQTYFDALYFCDTEKLNAVFHPASSLFDADSNGPVFVENIESFSNDVGGRESPASLNQAREEEVLLIDWLSPISTIVKIRLRAHKSIFVDHLSFVKGDQGWQIVAKVWHLEKLLDELP